MRKDMAVPPVCADTRNADADVEGSGNEEEWWREGRD
jgi:hypothetical protein